jgi:hypothetical protein
VAAAAAAAAGSRGAPWGVVLWVAAAAAAGSRGVPWGVVLWVAAVAVAAVAGGEAGCRGGADAGEASTAASAGRCVHARACVCVFVCVCVCVCVFGCWWVRIEVSLFMERVLTVPGRSGGQPFQANSMCHAHRRRDEGCRTVLMCVRVCVRA